MSSLGRYVSRVNTTTITKRVLLSSLSTRCQSDARTRDYFYDYRAKQTSVYASSNDFDPTDTAKVFQSMSSYTLIKYNLMFSMLSIKPLTRIMMKILIPRDEQSNFINAYNIPGMTAISAILDIMRNIISLPLTYIVRKQYFPLFTGGESIEECMALSKKYSDNNLRLIIDNSTEEGDSREVFAKNTASKKQLVDVSYESLGKSVTFMSIKMTSVASPTLLEELTVILSSKDCGVDRDPTPYMTEQQLAELDVTIATLSDICSYAKERGIGVWLDAEQYNRQNGMNYLSRRLMQIINPRGGDRIYLYNTYQCYLKQARDWIEFDIEHAKQNGYQCGVKLVRGAYLEHESALAKKENRRNPIQRRKEDTDESFDLAVEYVMGEMVKYYGNIGIAVCTHNRQSLQNTTEIMKRLGIERDDPFVYTAQLNGMVDNLTYSLGYTGYNALKLMPYGSFQDVWPFLLRRFEENSDILNGSQRERALYSKEIKRRMGFVTR